MVIGANEILTGAHVVANATFLQIQKLSDPNKAVARVKAVCHDSDLALLEVEPVDFLDDIDPAELGPMPRLRDKVSVVGFPVGGEEISVTEGVVSRVEVQRYSHSQRHLLAVTVDAAINAGNSGGPVFSDDKIVGIAFQKPTGAENAGEMVPPPVIRQFLDGVATLRRPEVPGLGISTQNLENPLLRKRAGLTGSQSGVLVIATEFGGSADGILQVGDALLEIDGLTIANNGTVRYLESFRTRYDVVLGQRYIGDRLPMKILRDGKEMVIELTLEPLLSLVPRAQYDKLPTYFVYAGLVFQTLTRDFLTTWDKWWNKAPKEFLYHYYSGNRTAERREVVILTQILADEINQGYAHLYNEGIIAVDGVMPRDMLDFVERVASATGIVEIKTSTHGVIALDAAEVREATPRILERYHITRDRSDDVR